MGDGLNIYDGMSLSEIFKVMWYAGGNAKNMYIILSVIIFFLMIGYYVDFQHTKVMQKIRPLTFRYKGAKKRVPLYRQRKDGSMFYALKDKDENNTFYFKKEGNTWTLVNGQMRKEQQAAIIKALDKRFNTLNFIKRRLQEFYLSVQNFSKKTA